MNKHIKNNWTGSEINTIIELFPHVKTQEIADLLGVGYSTICTKATELGLKKTDEFLRSDIGGRFTKFRTLGSEYWFKKGHVPQNKGKKLNEYVRPEMVERIKKTSFKKGNLPPNTKTDYDISDRYEKTSILYKYIRLEKSKWVPLHIYNWEQKFGKIPEGMIVVFKTRNHENCNVENLELISRAEHMARNSIMRYPPELRHTMKLLSKLKKQIYGKEQNSGFARPSL